MDIRSDLLSIKIVLPDGNTLATYEQQKGKHIAMLGASHAYYDENKGRVEEFF